LHCDLLDRAILTKIILKVKSPHINKYAWVVFAKKNVFEGQIFWHWV
jgi:hypothetical protein